MSVSASHLHSIDPEALLQIKNLQLQARLLVDGIQSGLHRSPQQGFSVEFDEYRPYSIGDDPRTLDWRLYARSDRYCVKKYRDETNRRCFLLLDCSRSMDFGSLPHTKQQYARTLAATLAHYLWRQRDAVGLITFDEAIRDVIPARRRHGQLQRLTIAIERSASGTSSDLGLPLSHCGEMFTPRGLVVLISDFLAPLEPLVQASGLVHALGQEVVWIRVLDPAELDLKFDGAVTLRDAETDRVIQIDPAAAAEDYRRRFAEHAASLDSLAQQHGVRLLQTTTDRPISSLLLEWLATQAAGPGRRGYRSSGASGGSNRRRA